MATAADIPVQIVLRPYASSIPLASLAFGVGNVVYSSLMLHWIPPAETQIVALILLAFVAPLELGPSVMAFFARDGGGATAFAVFGAAWVVQGLELLCDPQQQPNHATAILLLSLSVCLVVLMVVTFKSKPLMGAILAVATLRPIGAAIYELTGMSWSRVATGWCGLLLALLAFYAALAFLEEEVTQRLSPLTFRTGEARKAMEAQLKDQISEIEKEAGVRKQL